MERFDRTTKLIGNDKLQLLKNAKVAVFGVGGVGSYTIEALARAGVGKLMIVDSDKVDITNINRQLIALSSTVGKPKVQVAKKRILDINPNIEIDAREVYFDKNSLAEFDLTQYDYIVDAIDSVTSKLLLVEYAKQNNINIISCMGTGNKLDPTSFEVADISKTEYCPLAKVMRKELKARGINQLKVVYSKEQPSNCQESPSRVPASISFVPSVAGLILAGEVIKDIIK